MSSRIACTGEIRDVRRAGRYAAVIVTITPTAYAARKLRGRNTSDCPDRSSPKVANRARSARASRMPRPAPTVAPSTPSTSASSCTDRTICFFDAPRARSRASSRLRWATRIEKVLTMMNDPTTRAMPAKISRNVVRNEIASSRSLADSSAASSPVTAW